MHNQSQGAGRCGDVWVRTHIKGLKAAACYHTHGLAGPAAM